MSVKSIQIHYIYIGDIFLTNTDAPTESLQEIESITSPKISTSTTTTKNILLDAMSSTEVTTSTVMTLVEDEKDDQPISINDSVEKPASTTSYTDFTEAAFETMTTLKSTQTTTISKQEQKPTERPLKSIISLLPGKFSY